MNSYNVELLALGLESISLFFIDIFVVYQLPLNKLVILPVLFHCQGFITHRDSSSVYTYFALVNCKTENKKKDAKNISDFLNISTTSEAETRNS